MCLHRPACSELTPRDSDSASHPDDVRSACGRRGQDDSLCHRVRTEGVQRWHQPDLAPTAHRHPSSSLGFDLPFLRRVTPGHVLTTAWSSFTHRLRAQSARGTRQPSHADPRLPEHPGAFFMDTQKETRGSHHEIIKRSLRAAG